MAHCVEVRQPTGRKPPHARSGLTTLHSLKIRITRADEAVQRGFYTSTAYGPPRADEAVLRGFYTSTTYGPPHAHRLHRCKKFCSKSTATTLLRNAPRRSQPPWRCPWSFEVDSRRQSRICSILSLANQRRTRCLCARSDSGH